MTKARRFYNPAPFFRNHLVPARGSRFRFPGPLFPVCLAVLAFLVLLPRPVTGETEPLRGGIFTTDLTVPRDLIHGGETLSADEVTKLAVMYNLDMRISRVLRRIKHEEKRIADAEFDTHLELFGTYDHDLTERFSAVQGDRELQGEAGFALSKKFPSGTELIVEGATQRNSTGNFFATQSRNYTSQGSVALKQPILRNFFGFIDRARLKQVKLDIRRFDFQTLDDIEASLLEVRTQYWNLLFAYRNLRNRMNALRKAQDFLKITTEKLDLGLTESPDVYAAEANTRQRVLEVLRSRNFLISQSQKLKILLNLGVYGLVVPSDSLEFKPVIMDFHHELDEALENRWDIQRNELEIQEQKLEIRIRRSERLPELELEGSYQSNGLDRELASSEGEIFSFNHPRYFAGVRFGMDLENREARGRYEQAELELQRRAWEFKQLRLNVRHQVDEAYRALLLAEEGVKQSREIERLEKLKLEEEEKDFNRGRSDSKKIIDFQEDVIEAETEAIRALVEHRIALDEFHRAQNRLLTATGVEGEAF